MVMQVIRSKISLFAYFAVREVYHRRQQNQETWYNILNVKEDASYEDIRGSYRSSLLNSHPDKLQYSSDTQNACEESGDRFMKGEISVVTPDDVSGTVILPCGSCSLKIRLMINVNVSSPIST
ncbi:hypothetical protein V2J09_015603 [Rumex salicifolius]